MSVLILRLGIDNAVIISFNRLLLGRDLLLPSKKRFVNRRE